MKKYFKRISVLIITLLLALPICVFAQENMTISSKTYTNLNGNPAKVMALFNTNKGYAFCVTPDKTGPKQGTSLTYKETLTDGGLIYLLNKNISSETDYVTTQLAIWKYYNNFTEPASDSYWSTANTLVTEAKKNKSTTYTPSISITNSDKTVALTEDGDNYKSGTYKITVNNVEGDVSAVLTDAPTGTKIMDKDGKETSNIKIGDEFYLLVPKANVTESTEFTLKVSGYGYKYSVERYKDSSSDTQELVTLVKEKQDVSTKTTFSITVAPKTCQKVGDKYYNKSGVEVSYEDYAADCESHTCEIIGSKYFGKNGTLVDEATYTSECTTPTVTVPDTADNTSILFLTIGTMLIGGTFGVLRVLNKNNKRV